MDFRMAFKDPGGSNINNLPAFGGGGFLIRARHFLYFENIIAIFLKTLYNRSERGTFDTLKRCSLFEKDKNIYFKSEAITFVEINH